VLQRWKRLWAVLGDEALLLYPSDSAPAPAAALFIEGASARPAAGPHPHGFDLRFPPALPAVASADANRGCAPGLRRRLGPGGGASLAGRLGRGGGGGPAGGGGGGDLCGRFGCDGLTGLNRVGAVELRGGGITAGPVNV
jgi:hypothetical protein